MIFDRLSATVLFESGPVWISRGVRDFHQGAPMPGGKNILVIHGPNLNLLGARETRHYGRDTLRAIDSRLKRRAKEGRVRLTTYQSNSESELVERIQQARREAGDFIIIN